MICDIAHIAGMVAVGLHPSPVPLADAVTTTTHKTLRGPRSGLILCKQQHAKAVDSNVFPGIQGGPLEHIIAAKAVAFGEALRPDFKEYQQRILDNAQALAAGLIEGGLRLVAGGTDTHLVLCDLRPKKLTGKIAEAALQQAHITTNKNMIPGDPEKPFVTSGLRLGTPALTTRGMGPREMKAVARLIVRVLDKPGDEAEIGRVRGEVHELARQFPLYARRLG
jgi:glycine hydroxymethyltransferase